MDYRKNMNTPRDMVDDEMLLRLIRETEPAAAVYGCSARKENHRRNSGSGNCGCRTPETRDLRRGCPEETKEERCGCERENNRPLERREERPGCCEEREWRNAGCRNEERVCEPCVHDEHMKNFALAMAYVPWQEWEKIYEDEEKALLRGTLFEALDLPWYSSACGCEREREDNCGNRSGTCRKCGDNR